MFLQLIFKRYRLRERKYLMALIYGSFYFLLFFTVLSLAKWYLDDLNILRELLTSLFVGVAMLIVYLIKWHIIHME